MTTEAPIREILQDLTMKINETCVDPFEAYTLLAHHLGKRGLLFDTYASSSITSGGHARNANLDIATVIRRNTDLAHELCEELFKVGQLNPQSTVEAVAVGKIKNWSQSDYMVFWLNVMGRIKPDGYGTARRVDDLRANFQQLLDSDAHLDMAVYNDPSAPPTDRAAHYMRHAELFSDVLHKQDDISPITRMVRLVDTDTSLGAQTENYFAKLMGIAVMNVAVARIGGTTAPNTTSLILRQDTKSIVEYGGQVFDPRKRNQLVLVHAEMPDTGSEEF